MKRFPKLTPRQIETGKTILPPLTTIFSMLLNCVLFQLGLCYEKNDGRRLIFILGCALFAVVCYCYFIHELRSTRPKLRDVLLPTLFLCWYAAYYLLYLLRFKLTGGFIEDAGLFAIMAFPAFIGGFLLAAQKRESSFFAALERLSFIALPCAVIYVNGAIFCCNPWYHGLNLGIINYMNFSYTLMPLLIAHVIQYVNAAPLLSPLRQRELPRPQLFRGAMIVLYWLAIIVSGTRRVYIEMVLFFLVLPISRLPRRSFRAELRRSACASGLLCALLLFNMFVYAPPGFFAVSRMDMFIDGLKQGELVTTKGEKSVVKSYIDELVNLDGGQQLTNLEDTDPSVDEESSTGEDEIKALNLKILDRGTLFQLAIKEFLKSPISGMGPHGYIHKYGISPHSAFLQLFCDTGLIGSGIFLFFVGIALFRLFAAAAHRPEVKDVFLLLLVYGCNCCIGGELESNSMIMFALGYALMLQLPKRQSKV